MSAARYAAQAAASETPREREARAFRHVNAQLAAATDTASRAAALHLAHRLWSILLTDLADPANALPPDLKARLISLGLWAQREAVARMSDQGSLEPLMAIHRDLIEALTTRPAEAAAPAAAASPPAPGPAFVAAVA